MRHSFKIVLLFIFTQSALHAQIAGRIYNYRPTGELGFLMKPLFSAEIMYMPVFEDDEWMRYTGSVTFLDYQPRMSKFPVYASGSGGVATVLPGELSYQKYFLLQGTFGIDVAFLKKDKWTAYFGTDVLVGLSSIDYSYTIQTLSDYGESGGGPSIGQRFRIGVEYKLNDNIYLFVHANRSFFYAEQPSGFSWANDYGVGMHYQFD